MGQDARDLVVDPILRVHDIDGLDVVDALVLPSAGAVNTGLTIIALALGQRTRSPEAFLRPVGPNRSRELRRPAKRRRGDGATENRGRQQARLIPVVTESDSLGISGRLRT